jgi:group II intron reverse transcriptase/maturase
MRSPENVLNSLQEHSAQPDYVYDRIYRNLYNQELFLQAYQNIYASQGNMTAGTDGQTIDAMSLERINRLIETLKDESYQPKPSRRTYIPKKNGKTRPLGIPSIDDKLVQEVIRMMLESMYENSFEDNSHGFRPNKSCHTALRMIQNRFVRCKWFVEGDIKGFFDNIDHNVMINILRKRIRDERFLRLIRKFLNAGYMEDNQLHQSYSGTPQGGIISPILANIYLDQFDKYMAELKKRFDRGEKRAVNKEYRKLSDKRVRLRRKLENTQSEEERQTLLKSIWELDKIHKSIPCKNPMDADFRRLQYVRYADDFIIGIIGTKEDARTIKQEISAYIASQLKLELSDEKTLVTKATDRAKFLGFEIRVTPQSNLTKKTKSGTKARNFSGHVMLEVPTSVIQKKLLELGAMKIEVHNRTESWTPIHRGNLVGRTDLSILDQYNGEVRGFCNYYSIANNRSKLHKFRYIMEYSFYKTLACKYRTSKRKIIAKYRIGKDIGVKYQDNQGKEKVRLFWRGTLARNPYPMGSETDVIHKPKGILKKPSLGMRLKANRCEWCGEETSALVVHQVKTLKELDENKPWAVFMKKINRKTMVVCESCHLMIHSADCE